MVLRARVREDSISGPACQLDGCCWVCYSRVHARLSCACVARAVIVRARHAVRGSFVTRGEVCWSGSTLVCYQSHTLLLALFGMGKPGYSGIAIQQHGLTALRGAAIGAGHKL